MEKKNIKKYAATGLLAVALLGVGLDIKDAKVNHEEEWCPLNHIFGMQHQVNKINSGLNSFRFEAVLVPENKNEIVPEGYTQYQGTYGQHVVEYVSFYADPLKPLEDDSVYAIRNGFLEKNAIPYGQERIEVYDHNAVSEDPQLIRVFKSR